MSQQYEVAAQTAKNDVTSAPDIYRSPFSDKGEEAYIWSQKASSLEDIVTGSKLPLVVKLNEENVVKEKESPVDLQRPLLLFREVKAKKLHARNIRPRAAARDDRTIYDPVGPFVILPENFVGYFKSAESTNTPLPTVADIGRHMPESFISLEETQGFIALTQVEGTFYQKGPVAPGLFRVKNILEETIPYLNKRKNEKHKLLRCLSCIDEKGRIVLFSLETKGSFYLAEVGSKAKTSQKHSGAVPSRAYKWTDLDSSRLSGLRVKMVHGKPPSQECQFTGWLEFSHVVEDHTVIGCTMMTPPRLFEMAVTSEPYFNVALNSEGMESIAIHQKCLKYIKAEYAVYMKTIKVRKDYDIEQADIEKDSQ